MPNPGLQNIPCLCSCSEGPGCGVGRQVKEAETAFRGVEVRAGTYSDDTVVTW